MAIALGKKVTLTNKPVGGFSGLSGTAKLRKKFIDGVERQRGSLDAPENVSRKWWTLTPSGTYLVDVRYGSSSLLPEGKVAVFNTKEEINDFFDYLVEQAQKGEFDKELSAVSERVGRRLSGAAGGKRRAA